MAVAKRQFRDFVMYIKSHRVTCDISNKLEDDDIILDKSWLQNTIHYSKNNGWNVLANRVTSPDGTRYWDRATIQPHSLVDYSTSETNPALYQNSAFFLVRKVVFENVKWNEDRYAFSAASAATDKEVPHLHKEGDIGEDVQYSIDLRKMSYTFSFNTSALAWHYDESYTQFQNLTLRKNILEEKLGISFFPPPVEEFDNLLENL
jgi:GT2 family glycosyltransferase